MGPPEIKYGESLCFVQHVASGLWLTYAAPDPKALRLGVLKKKVGARRGEAWAAGWGRKGAGVVTLEPSGFEHGIERKTKAKRETEIDRHRKKERIHTHTHTHTHTYSGREVQEGGGICMLMADFYCCTAETNETL